MGHPTRGSCKIKLDSCMNNIDILKNDMLSAKYKTLEEGWGRLQCQRQLENATRGGNAYLTEVARKAADAAAKLEERQQHTAKALDKLFKTKEAEHDPDIIYAHIKELVEGHGHAQPHIDSLRSALHDFMPPIDDVVTSISMDENPTYMITE
jgi:hypothetical protein